MIHAYMTKTGSKRTLFQNIQKRDKVMPQWTYKTSIIDPDQVIPPDKVQCDLSENCIVKDLRESGLKHFKKMPD